MATLLAVYLMLMLVVSPAVSIRRKFPYGLAATQSLAAASNNFELAIAAALCTFGIASQEAHEPREDRA